MNYRGLRRRRRKKGYEKNFEEVIVHNFPNLEKEMVNQVQEAQRVPYRINPRKNTPRHRLIKLTMIKHREKILKAARENRQVTYKGHSIHLIADLSAEILQARKECQDIFKVEKGKNLQPRLLYPARISFKIDGKIKSFSNKQKLENSVPPNQLYNKYEGAYKGRKNQYCENDCTTKCNL